MDGALCVVCELLEEHSGLAGGITCDLGMEREPYIEEFGEDDEVSGCDCGGVDKLKHAFVVCLFVFPADIELDEVGMHWRISYRKDGGDFAQTGWICQCSRFYEEYADGGDSK